ncbi:MAG: S41 family peptidase, partial [Opitutales bacterium]
FLNKKAYIDHANAEVPLGAEVIAINGVTIDKVMAKLLPYIRSDGYNVTLKYRQMEDEFALHYFLSFGRKETFQVEYVPFGSGKKSSKPVQSIPAKKLEGLLAERHSHIGKLKKYKLSPVDEGIQLFSMNTFDFGLNKKGRQKYKSFLRENFEALEENDAGKCIILDLRQNDGGYMGNDAQLFSYFAQAPFRDVKSAETKTLAIPVKDHLARNQFPKMLERILGKEFHKADLGRYAMLDEKNREWEPRKKAFDGHIYTLVSGWTHSGGVVLCSFLLNNDNVTFIGEETGGGHATFTAGNMVLYDLPNTRCQLEVPLIQYENYRGDRTFPKGSGVRPDHPVAQSQKDLVANVDTVMEFALALARKTANGKAGTNK